MSGAEEVCALCTNTADQQCGACMLVYYCSVECQRKHWAVEHRYTCAGKRVNRRRPDVQFDAQRAHQLSVQHCLWTVLQAPDRIASISDACNEAHAQELALLSVVPMDEYRKLAMDTIVYLKRNKWAHITALFNEGWSVSGPGAVLMHFVSLESARAHRYDALVFIPQALLREYTGTTVDYPTFDHTVAVLFVVSIKRGILVDHVEVTVQPQQTN